MALVTLDLTSFTKQIESFIEDTKKEVDEVLQEVIVEIGTRLIKLSPVKTGRFRGNWQLTVDVPANSSLAVFPDEEGAIASLVSKSKSFNSGEIAYIVNHIQYGHEIEYLSWSRQAPNGVLRITAAQFSDIIDEVVRRRGNGG